jgi:hypothetical protein
MDGKLPDNVNVCPIYRADTHRMAYFRLHAMCSSSWSHRKYQILQDSTVGGGLLFTPDLKLVEYDDQKATPKILSLRINTSHGSFE